MIGFFEAFPELSVDDKMYDMFAGVQVEKVNALRQKCWHLFIAQVTSFCIIVH